MQDACAQKLGKSIPVVILHWNRPEECLATCSAFKAEKANLELLVLDNNSQPSKWGALQAKLPPGIHLHRLAENKGWGAALNMALDFWLRNEESEYCIVSAHDALLEPECIQLMLDSMGSRPDVGIACPEYGRDDMPRFSPVRGPRLRRAVRRPSGSVELVDYVHGTVMLFRRSCLLQIGLFDEKYFAYGDETEIGLRARKFGWACAMIWGARVTNPGTWTPGATMSYLFARNTLLMAEQFGGLSSALVRVLLMLPNTLRLLLLPSVRPYGFVPVARLRGIRDFLLRKFGRPEFQS